MLWADITKYVRSVLFKNELSNGSFKVKQASEDDNGTNIAERFEEIKNYINRLAETIKDTSNRSVTGAAQSSNIITAGYGYYVSIEILVENLIEEYYNVELSTYTGFNSKPNITISDGKVRIAGYSDSANSLCRATITYEININEFE